MNMEFMEVLGREEGDVLEELLVIGRLFPLVLCISLILGPRVHTMNGRSGMMRIGLRQATYVTAMEYTNFQYTERTIRQGNGGEPVGRDAIDLSLVCLGQVRTILWCHFIHRVGWSRSRYIWRIRHG